MTTAKCVWLSSGQIIIISSKNWFSVVSMNSTLVSLLSPAHEYKKHMHAANRGHRVLPNDQTVHKPFFYLFSSRACVLYSYFYVFGIRIWPNNSSNDNKIHLLGRVVYCRKWNNDDASKICVSPSRAAQNAQYPPHISELSFKIGKGQMRGMMIRANNALHARLYFNDLVT